MSEESTTPDLVELVQRLNEAWNRRDVDGVLRCLSLDVVYRTIPTFTDSEERRGFDAFRGFMDEFHEAWADDFIVRAESIRGYCDAVIGLFRFSGHADASGVEVAGGVFQVFRFREGHIVRVEDFTDRSEALEAVGLAE